jgi:hypothetical protein
LVRAKTEAEDFVPPELQVLADQFVELLNGDHRQPRIEHYCHQLECCGGQRKSVCIKRTTQLILQLFFAQLGVDLPAANRWYSFSPHLSRQCGGILCHSILPRVVKQAFTIVPSDGEDEDNSYHAHANNKKTSLEFLTQEKQAAECLGIALIGVAPLDSLSHRLQHLDYNRGSLKELMDATSKGVLAKTQTRLWQILNCWHKSSHSAFLPALQWHLEARGANAQDVAKTARATCVGLAAAVWARLELKYPSLSPTSAPARVHTHCKVH